LRAGPQPGVQNPFGPLQITPDVGPPQATSPATPSQPHCPVAGRHCGWAPPHSAPFVAEHSVHEPASGPAAWQAGRAGSAQVGAPSPAQGTHAWVAGEQTGVAPPQSALAMQPTHTPPPPVVSHSGVAAEQRLVSVGVQTAQAPVLKQTGNLGSQSALSRQPRHVFVVASHTGRTPAQSAPEAHSTQALVVGSQTLPAAAHAPGLPAPQATHWPPAPQTGVEAPQSASATHGRQVWVAPSHVGVAPLQSALARHDTHVPAPVSQSGVAPVHAVRFVAEQTPQAPPGWQAGFAPRDSASPTQPRHSWVVPSHTGEEAAHSLLARHPWHVPVAVAHTGVAPPQAAAFVAEHWPQAPLGWQAGAAPPQSASPAQGRHMFVPVSQTGLVPPHWPPDPVHETHTPVVASQPETGPVHFVVLVAEHTPQAPLGWQAGVAPPQSASPAQARHACIVGLQMGVSPAHWALVTQPTQVPLVASQFDVAPAQRRRLVAEHWPQAPLGWQAGVVPPHCASLVQATQVRVPASQTGVVPEQSALVTQRTHVPVPASQIGVAPPQASEFVAEHSPHEPPGWHAGATPPHSPSPAHARHVLVATLQTGLAPLQSAPLRQPTHVPTTVLHTGVAPAQAVAFVAEHAPHEPPGWHAGVEPPQSASAAQARHV
jgi:hypothetical protein